MSTRSNVAHICRKKATLMLKQTDSYLVWWWTEVTRQPALLVCRPLLNRAVLLSEEKNKTNNQTSTAYQKHGHTLLAAAYRQEMRRYQYQAEAVVPRELKTTEKRNLTSSSWRQLHVNIQAGTIIELKSTSTRAVFTELYQLNSTQFGWTLLSKHSKLR